MRKIVEMNLRYIIVAIAVLVASTSFAQTHTIHFDREATSQTISKWSKALLAMLNTDSTSYIKKKSGGVDRLHRSGHRDVIVWIPKATDLTKKTKVILWFHGHRGYRKGTFQNRILHQFSPLVGLENFVVVLPEMPWSVNTKTPTKRNGYVWTVPGSFLKFINQVKSVLASHVAQSATAIGDLEYKIVGHSAGGSTISRIAATGDLCKVENLTKIVWSDSTYGSQLQRAWMGCLGSSGILTEVFTLKWTITWKNTRKFLKIFKIRSRFLKFYEMSRPWTHRKIGNNIVKISSLLE